MPYRSFNSFCFDLIKSELFSCTFFFLTYRFVLPLQFVQYSFCLRISRKSWNSRIQEKFRIMVKLPNVSWVPIYLHIKIIWELGKICNLIALHRISIWLIKEIDNIHTYLIGYQVTGVTWAPWSFILTSWQEFYFNLVWNWKKDVTMYQYCQTVCVK